MRADSSSDLARRAALHAALADPARLQIVDTLSLGDAAPSELAGMLAMPSNLLAHHLRVLEREGLITRTRSEGDKRRSYLQLVSGLLEQLMRQPPRHVTRLVFVCTANSARSHLAAALWRYTSEVPATSAGTDPAKQIDPRAVATAERHQLPMRRSRPRHLDDVHAGGDLVITVCDLAHEELGNRADLHWSVPDPARIGRAAAFDRAYYELARRVHELAPRVHTPSLAS